jgi:hypothetical protein
MRGVKGIEYYTSRIIIVCQTNKLIDKYGKKSNNNWNLYIAEEKKKEKKRSTIIIKTNL